ncbi:hypothetical protein lwe0985 [Listeria welshimeri serovar 6b str. SLCC5334]|uniref:Uncharacterized protein n=1 Tax=Listeria welshimeri serovar 6b (strain ATCC 35897 / DSM 20650 / CCUG 15529 / CIP 8149 / NCTC 11857 / SLCC 5334 / V8) TaxID=386043 RepID=A0AHC1_LISW6|nr:hypothetical protein lwe0985 [Listeria welshimeri serovar 6b str. SLCC5334]
MDALFPNKKNETGRAVKNILKNFQSNGCNNR